MAKKCVTIDQAITKLQQFKEESTLKGDTVLHICLLNSGIEYLIVKDLKLEQDDDGAVVKVMGSLRGYEGAMIV